MSDQSLPGLFGVGALSEDKSYDPETSNDRGEGAPSENPEALAAEDDASVES